MSELDIWTVSLLIRTEDSQTRADAFLQGPAVEVECSAWADAEPADPGAAAIVRVSDDLAAARVLEELSRRLFERVTGNSQNIGRAFLNENRHLQLLPKFLELIHRGRAVNVRRNQQRRSPLLLEPAGEFSAGRGFAGPVQSDHQ